MQLLWMETLAGGEELISVWPGHQPQRDDCEEKMRREILERELQQMGDKSKKKKKCGETERDTGRSVEAHVAAIPRMCSDSGQLNDRHPPPQ